MRVVRSAIAAVGLVLATANVLAFAVGGIWLLVLAEWKVILGGIGLLAVANWIIGLLMAPGLVLAGTQKDQVERQGGSRIVPLYASYVAAIQSIWAIAVLALVKGAIGDQPAIPFYLWSYGLATGPWVTLARAEQSNEFSSSANIFLQCGYLAAITAAILFGAPFSYGMAAIIAAMAASAVFQVYLFRATA